MNALLYPAGIAALLVAFSGNPVSAQDSTPAPAVSPLGPRLLQQQTRGFETLSVPDRPPGVAPAAWTAARGTWESAVEDGLFLVHAAFSGLIPGGQYALLARHTNSKGPSTVPLDRSGAGAFAASPSGTATMTISVAQAPVRGDTIMLVYRASDGAHVQLRLVMR